MTAMEPVLIAGAWRPAAAVDSYRALDPATGQPRDAVWPVSSWSDVAAALAAAVEAAAALAQISGEAIAHFLECYAGRLEARGDDLVMLAHAETGLAVKPRLTEVELPRTLDQLRQAAAAARERLGRGGEVAALRAARL